MITPTNDTQDDPFPSANPIPFRQIMAMLSESVAVLSKGRVIYANTALCELSGKNRGEIIILLVNKYIEALLGCSMNDFLSGKHHLFDFVHPDYLSRVIDFYNGFPDTHESSEMEYRIISNDRKIKWVRDMGNTLYVERGRGMPRRIDHTLVDITDQKNKELELEEERRKDHKDREPHNI